MIGIILPEELQEESRAEQPALVIASHALEDAHRNSSSRRHSAKINLAQN